MDETETHPTHMHSTFLRFIAIVFATASLSIGLSLAGPYIVGSKVEPFTAKDQHERTFTLNPAEIKFLLVSHDMETGKKANAALNALGKEYLDTKHAIYVANIHGMPGIGRMFAMPKMKKYVHRIILGDDELLIARFSEQKSKVTVLKLNGGRVDSISYWAPGNEGIETALK